MKRINKEIMTAINDLAEQVDVVVTALDNNPTLEEAAARLLSKYGNLFWPLLRDANKVGIEIRKQAFVEFKAMGLDDELAVQLVNGR
jgi:hypothetical protein